MCVHTIMPYGIIHWAPVTAWLFSEVQIPASTHSQHPHPSLYKEAFSLQDNDSGIELCHRIMISCG